MRNRYLQTGFIFCLLLCFLTISVCHLQAADRYSHIHFKRLSVENGLPQNTVLALTQDHNGKIWAGTFDGLCWYDGYRFSSFYKDLNDSTSLSNNHIYSLCTDKEGTVWVGTLTGLSRYNIVGNNFTNYSLPGVSFQVVAWVLAVVLLASTAISRLPSASVMRIFVLTVSQRSNTQSHPE